MKILSKKFFQDKNTPRIAKNLLGKILIRRRQGKNRAYIITEVEAYNGPRDKASHAHCGKTARNAPMFGEAGYWYVYFVYGMHWMPNIVTGPKDYPAAILIRGALLCSHSALFFQRTDIFLLKNSSCSLQSSSQGAEKIAPRSSPAIQRKSHFNGPSKLSRALCIDKKINGRRANKKTGLWIEDWGIKIPRRAIKKTHRIGVSYAKEWAKRPYRFVIEANCCCFNIL